MKRKERCCLTAEQSGEEGVGILERDSTTSAVREIEF